MNSTEKTSIPSTSAKPVEATAALKTNTAAATATPGTPVSPVDAKAKMASEAKAVKAPRKASVKVAPKATVTAQGNEAKIAKVTAAVAPTSPVKKALKSPLKSPAKALKAPTKPAKSVNKKIASKATPKAPTKPQVDKLAKAKKPKLVRDSFTIPKVEFTVLDDLKVRAGKLANSAKKSELIRAGIKALASMTDAAFLVALKAVPAIKTGRPAKE